MADVIAASDQALIEAALAAGGVTRVPRGVSGLPQYVCDPQTGKLVTGHGESWKDVSRARGMRMSARRRRMRAAAPGAVASPVEKAPPPITTTLAVQIRDGLLNGETPSALARRVGTSKRYVCMIAKRLRTTGLLPPLTDPVDRSEQVVALHEAGLSFSQVAERLNMTRSQVGGIVSRARARAARAAAKAGAAK